MASTFGGRNDEKERVSHVVVIFILPPKKWNNILCHGDKSPNEATATTFFCTDPRVWAGSGGRMRGRLELGDRCFAKKVTSIVNTKRTTCCVALRCSKSWWQAGLGQSKLISRCQETWCSKIEEPIFGQSGDQESEMDKSLRFGHLHPHPFQRHTLLFIDSGNTVWALSLIFSCCCCCCLLTMMMIFNFLSPIWWLDKSGKTFLLLSYYKKLVCNSFHPHS